MSESKTYTEEEVDGIKEEMRELFEGEFSGLRSEVSRLNKKLNVELRTNEQSGDIFSAMHKFSENSAHVALNIVLKWFKDFGDLEHFGEHYYTPKRNWLQVFMIAALLSGGFLLLIPDARISFANWYSSGINSYLFFLFIAIAIGTFFYLRRRSVKTTQTQV